MDVVELKKGLLGKPKLIKSGRVTISPEPGEVDDKKISSAIQRVLQENNIENKSVITAVPKEEVIIRYFKMRYLPKKERDAAVKFEAKKYIPFKLEELASDFHIVEPPKGSKEMNVIFIAVKKEVLERHISLLTNAGLKASSIEVPSFSLLRIFGLSGDIKEKETTVIVNVNADSITISILKAKVLYLTRNIKMSSRRLEGEEKSTEFESLVSELQLSLDYYKKQFPGSEIEKVILSGEAELEGWDKLLNQELKIPVVIGDPRKALVGSGKMSSQMAVAAGLALQGLFGFAAEVNLATEKGRAAMPVFLISKEAAKKIVFQEVIIAASLLLLLHIVMTVQAKKVKNKLSEVIELRPKVTMQLAADFMTPKDLEKAEKDLAQKQVFLTSVIDKKICWTEKISELGKLLPRGTWLDSLTITETIEQKNNITKSLIIQGGAFSKDERWERQLVNSLENNIREDELFNKGIQNINLAFIQRETMREIEVTKFKLICTSEAYSPK